jgi:hypothetical protein
MKVEICNLGVIQKAHIDLKPLTVFIGSNGTGKTWTAYTLASILGKHGFERYLEAYINDKTREKYAFLYNAIEQFFEIGNSQINLISLTEEYLGKYINDVSNLAPSWLSSFLDTERVNFNNLEVSFNLDESKRIIVERIKKYSLDRRISLGSQLSLQTLKQEDGEDIYFYRVLEGETSSLKLPNVLKKIVSKFFSETIFSIFHECLYSYVYIFPTERTTYVGFPFLVEKGVNIKLENMIENIKEGEIKNNNEHVEENTSDKTDTKPGFLTSSKKSNCMA